MMNKKAAVFLAIPVIFFILIGVAVIALFGSVGYAVVKSSHVIAVAIGLVILLYIITRR